MPKLSLFKRVLIVNAALLAGAAIALAASPLTVSEPIRSVEALILFGGVWAVLVCDYVLLRHIFDPLDRLARKMRSVDLLRPGVRLSENGDGEIAELVNSFNEMLDRLEVERRESGRRALEAQEAERSRVAKELHDEVGQSMTGVLLLLERLSSELPRALRPNVYEAQEQVRASLNEVRRVAQELRPELLEHLGLVSALKALARGFAERTGLELDGRFPNSLPQLQPEAELVVYRVAQESLTNVARHADAGHVWVSLDQSRNTVVLRVVDDGRGMNTESDGHGGLRGMRERSVIVGGALAIKRAVTGGVEVRLEVPAANNDE